MISNITEWAVFISQFNFANKHIDGHDNDFADTFARWKIGGRVQQAINRKVAELYQDIGPSAENTKDINILTWEEIRNEQVGFPKSEKIIKDSDCILRKNKKWILREAKEIKLKILVGVHCGQRGPRGNEGMETKVKETFE